MKMYAFMKWFKKKNSNKSDEIPEFSRFKSDFELVKKIESLFTCSSEVFRRFTILVQLKEGVWGPYFINLGKPSWVYVNRESNEIKFSSEGYIAKTAIYSRGFIVLDENNKVLIEKKIEQDLTAGDTLYCELALNVKSDKDKLF